MKPEKIRPSDPIKRDFDTHIEKDTATAVQTETSGPVELKAVGHPGDAHDPLDAQDPGDAHDPGEQIGPDDPTVRLERVELEELDAPESEGTEIVAASTPDSSIWHRLPGGPWLWLLGAVVVILGLVFIRGRSGSQDPLMDGPRPVPVRATHIIEGDLSIVSVFPGELTGEVADLAPQVAGLLSDVPVRIGAKVKHGQVIAIIDDVNLRNQMLEARGQLGVAEANVRRSEAELEGVQADHRRSEELFGENLLSAQEFDRVVAQLASARASLAASEAQVEQSRARVALLEKQLSDTRVVAPFSGTVATRYLDRGTLVQAGTPILRLVEDGSLMVQFRVPERDLAAAQVGVVFEVTTQATADQTFRGVIQRISGEVSRSDRTALVEGTLEESVELLRPGMYAEVRVRLQELRDVLLMPDQAVLQRFDMAGNENFGVFLAESDTARWVPVVLLGRADRLAAVEGLLQPGDRVLTLGHSELQDQSRVDVVQTQTFDRNAIAAAGDRR